MKMTIEIGARTNRGDEVVCEVYTVMGHEIPDLLADADNGEEIARALAQAIDTWVGDPNQKACVGCETPFGDSLQAAAAGLFIVTMSTVSRDDGNSGGVCLLCDHCIRNGKTPRQVLARWFPIVDPPPSSSQN
jgi:hypothetical protein